MIGRAYGPSARSPRPARSTERRRPRPAVICSVRACAPERFNTVVRSHWGIENQLHWVLDVIMDEDQARNRKDHGPQNLALLRKLALNLAKLEPSKGSMRGKLKRAGWDNAFLAQILTLFANLQMR